MNKIVVLDLDGTLLKNDKTVSEETIKTLLKFKQMNNKILFATARPPRDAYKYVPEILRDNPIICYNGACIIDNQKNILYRKEISKENALNILKVAKDFGYNQICFEINDKLYSTFDTTPFFGNALNQIVDLENMEFESVFKVIICSQEKILPEFNEAIKIYAKGVITDNGKLCQIMNEDVSKWSSIQAIIKKEKIDIKNVIAFGDDYNDYEMIKYSGIGVAMENAEEVIKQVADYVTQSNMTEGISSFIKKMLL